MEMHEDCTGANEAQKGHLQTTYSRVACIGAGFSGIGVGANLYRWYGITDVQLFERRASSGGTWYANTYPGCACDVPSALYSYSFEQNPNWTKLLPPQKELKAYLDSVATKYRLDDRMRFHVEVQGFTWCDESQRWILSLLDLKTHQKQRHICQVLFNCGGALVKPNPVAFPGQQSFKGDIFHSAEWNHNVVLKDKKVIVIGNGCTGAQIVPALLRQGEIASVTNIVRSKQWIYPSLDFHYSSFMRWCFRNVPFALLLHRLQIFLYAEKELPSFQMNEEGARFRENRRKFVEDYMRSTAPAEYHDMLIPKFEIGCKRRIYDSGYLEALHDPKVGLTNSPIREIVPQGIRTDDGIVEADVIVVANGYDVHHPLPTGMILGRNGEDLAQHWAKYDGPGAYNGSAVASFPNLFFILGPNSGTGHTSALVQAENQIYQALRVLKPVLKGQAATVEVTETAETDFVLTAQAALQNLIWHKGSCSSWFENDKGWNPALYPWSPADFWRRCLFPTWSHWQYTPSKHAGTGIHSRHRASVTIGAAVLAIMAVAFVFAGPMRPNYGFRRIITEAGSWLGMKLRLR